MRRSFDRTPDAGLGALLGPLAGVVDIEVDGPDGDGSFLTLVGGEVVETLGWSSRRGAHRLFLWDDRLAALGKTKIITPQLPDLEIRLGGGDAQMQSAVPPTVGEDGEPRRWNGCDMIAPFPEAALRFLTDSLSAPGPGPTDGRVGRVRTQSASDPAAAWFGKALANEAGKVATARETTRHQTLLAAARTLGGMLHHDYFRESDVIDELTNAGRRAGLPDDEVSETIRDGLNYGTAAPMPWPDKLGRTDGAARNGRGHVPGNPDPEPWSPLRLNETPKCPPFPLDVFPPPLRDYCREVAETILSPTDYVGASILAVAGAAIGQTVNLTVKRGWNEPALLWVILVGRPGTAKSPVIAAQDAISTASSMSHDAVLATSLRYAYEIRDPAPYFEDIPDVKIPNDMLKLAEHIVREGWTPPGGDGPR